MKRVILFSIVFLSQVGFLIAQVVSSNEITIHINNLNPPDKVMENFGDYYALIIGINNYSDSIIHNRGNSIENATSFYELITSKYIFEKDKVRFLQDATLSEIKDAFDSYSKKVSSNDSFLIYFSGQGYWDETSNSGFWLPSDAKGIGFWVVPGNEEESSNLAWLSNDALSHYLQKINSKHTLLITDTFFGGDKLISLSPSDSDLNPISELNERSGKKAITGGIYPNETIQSDFIDDINKYLKSNNEKYLPSAKLFINFSKTLPSDIRFEPQFGEINSLGDEGGDFIFILK